MDRTVIATAVGLDAKTAEFPQRPLGAEAMRCLYDADQHRRPDRTHRRNLAEQLPRRVFLALSQQLAPHLLAQRPQRIELLVVKLRAAVHPGFADLRQPLRPVARCIDLLAGARDGPTAVHRFHPGHDPRESLLMVR